MSVSQPRPLLTLHVGQAGIQIGHAIWELLCLEHNIETDGSPKLECGSHGNVDTVFIGSAAGSYFPRSILVDTDPTCVDEIRSGPYRGLFNRRQLVSDELDSGANYATGRYAYTTTLLPETLDRLRWLIEKTDVTPTVCLMHSACGGTGSGFAVACLNQALGELGINKQGVLDFCVVPGRSAIQSSCELLNTALYLDESQEFVRQTFCVSNSALFRVCAGQLDSCGQATYAHANRILAAAFSNLTATERLSGSSVSLYSILDSLLPYEHLRYPLIACAPFQTHQNVKAEDMSAKSATITVMEADSQFLDVKPREGRHTAGFLLYRGAVTITEAQKLAADLCKKGRAQFHDWAPAGFRAGVVPLPLMSPPGAGMASPAVSVTMVTTHSAISGIFSRLASAAKRLQEADLFVHSYEGAIVALLGRDGAGGAGGGGSGSGFTSESTSADAYTTTGKNNISDWMSSPVAGQRGDSASQLLRRHLQQQRLQQQQQQQQRREHRASRKQAAHQDRTNGLSDVFGVRFRLWAAINYLEQVAKVYANHQPKTPAAPVAEDAPAKVHVPTPTVDKADGVNADDSDTQVVPENSSSQEDSATPDDLDEEVDNLPHELQVKQQQQQSQYQPTASLDTSCSATSLSSSSSREDISDLATAADSTIERMRRAAMARFGCLRRGRRPSQNCQQPQEHNNDQQRQFSWSPRQSEVADSQSAIAEAERVLTKYRSQNT